MRKKKLIVAAAATVIALLFLTVGITAYCYVSEDIILFQQDRIAFGGVDWEVTAEEFMETSGQSGEFGWSALTPSAFHKSWAIQDGIVFSKDFYAPKLRAWVEADYYFNRRSDQKFLKGVYCLKTEKRKTKALAKRLADYLKPYQKETALSGIAFVYGSISGFVEKGIPCLLCDRQHGCVRLSQRAIDENWDETVLEIFQSDREAVWEQIEQKPDKYVTEEVLTLWRSRKEEPVLCQDMLMLEFVEHWSGWLAEDGEWIKDLYGIEAYLDPVILVNPEQKQEMEAKTDEECYILNEERKGDYYYFSEDCRYLLQIEEKLC